MQSKDNPNFYLKHGFDKGYTDYGCPYVSEECDVNKPSDNLIIYGHNMKNGSMFSALNQFKSKGFGEEHRAVYFNTLYEKQSYEIVAVFKTAVYTDTADEFRYYRFVNAEPPDLFDEYIGAVKARSFYDTGVSAEYGDKLTEIKNGATYDVLEMSGSRAVWKEVIAVYAAKTNADPDNPQEVATMDDGKKQLLSDLFWEMNEITSRTEGKSKTEITETDDGNGNIVQTETTVTRTYLYITVTHKTVEEMAQKYGFNQEQKDYLAELLKDKNNSLWSAVLYGINYSDEQLVTVALSQIGNASGTPYWSWYCFDSRVEWCACFVSWCANACGYIETGVIPKYAGCVNGVNWFKDRGQWADGSSEPVPGMIIFFDWDNKGSSGSQDGQSDHTGIVQKVENGIVYTVEGNSGDSVRVNQYAVGHYEILGYGIPQY